MTSPSWTLDAGQYLTWREEGKQDSQAEKQGPGFILAFLQEGSGGV